MTERADDRVWKQVGALLGGVVAVATIHGVVIVPSILAASARESLAISKKEIEPLQAQVDGHLASVEVIRATLATKTEIDAIARQITGLEAQLDRIEARLAR